MKNLQDLKQELLKNPRFREEYYKKDEDFDIAQKVMRARIEMGLTQKELAKRIGTKQPSIARVESGAYTPSLKLLRAVANALDVNLDIHFTKALD